MDPVRFSPEMSSIGSIKSVSDYESTPLGPAPAVGFSDVMAHAVDEAAGLAHIAEGKAAALAAGTNDDLHGTMIAMKEAEISMKLVGSIRNKVLDAFHELWRTSV